jgi:hypothetical protein
MFTLAQEAILPSMSLGQFLGVVAFAVVIGVANALASKWITPKDETAEQVGGLGNALARLASELQADRASRKDEFRDAISLALRPLESRLEHLTESVDAVSSAMVDAVKEAAEAGKNIAVQGQALKDLSARVDKIESQ